MLICKVAAKRACPYVFPAFSAGDCASVPFGSWCPSGAHPEVGFGRELKADGTGRAGHRLRLLDVSLKTNTFECADKTVDRLL
jgi:hypothetical protein